MKTCPKCQSVVSDTAKFCVECGFNIKKYEENAAQEHFCPECGTKFSGGSFCPECGTSISDQPCVCNESFDSIGNFDFSALESEAREQLLAAFKYEQMSNGMYIIKALKNSAELIVEIPDCVQIIDESAFRGSSVIEVTLPEGLVKIGARAFADCSDLEKINFPSTLRIIEDEAFSGCIQLDVEAPNDVRCGENVLKNTLHWNKQQKQAEEERIRNEESIFKRKYTKGLRFEKDGQEYYVYGYVGEESNVVVPEIYDELPVTGIKEKAFYGCEIITSITIPTSVKSIGDLAFLRCSSCISISVDERNAFFKSIDGDLYSKDGTKLIQYAIGKREKKATIPDGVTEIANCVFCGCTTLTSVNIPNSVTQIGKQAFYGCSSLESIAIPKGVKSIGEYAFGSCGSLKEVIILEGITTINNRMFDHCLSLKGISIPKSVKSIKDYVFWCCSSLEWILLPEGIKSIGENTFAGCKSLGSISIPKSINRIGKDALAGCSKLETIKVPYSLSYSSHVRSLQSGNKAKIIYY